MWPAYKFWIRHEGTAASTAVIPHGTLPEQGIGSRLCIAAAGSLRSPPGADDKGRTTQPPVSTDDDMGWLSLSSDADGHGLHEHDVLCMGVIPDDLDRHDSDGGDLSWIGLVPADAATKR